MKLLFFFLFLFHLAFFHCTGSRPGDLGVRQNKLKPCPSSPNCVSSFENPSDNTHFIEPLLLNGSPKESKDKIKSIVSQIPRTKLVLESDDYLYYEFTSFLFRYVDDVEFYFSNSDKKIHTRSASRLGYGDMNVNRKRIEGIRESIQKP